jgi:hypothetical protein
MKKSNLEELMSALETIRAKQHPEIPKELLDALLQLEFDKLDNRADAQSACMKVLDDYLTKIIG